MKTTSRYAWCAKLSDDDVLAIIRSEGTNQQLADQYGVSDSTINNIRIGKSYQWVHPEVPRRKAKPAAGPRCTDCVHCTGDRCMLGFPEFQNRNYRAAATCSAYTDQPLRFPWMT